MDMAVLYDLDHADDRFGCTGWVEPATEGLPDE
jgi:hypothetical protein